MTDETNGADMAAAEAAAVALNQPSGEKTYLEEKAPEPDPKADETPGEADAAAKAEPEAQADKPKPKKTAQERIDELTWRVREAERREAALLDRIGGNQAPAQEAHPQPTDGRPDPSSYELGIHDPQYLEQLTDWKADQAVTRRLSEREARQTIQTQLSTFEGRLAEQFPEGKTEGLDAFYALPEISQAITDVILASDVGPKIAEHLGDHPSEFKRLSDLSPALQARELTLLETRLTAPKEEPKPTPKTLTDAPEPPPQNRGAGGRFTVAADTNDFAAFEKQYRIGG